MITKTKRIEKRFLYREILNKISTNTNGMVIQGMLIDDGVITYELVDEYKNSRAVAVFEPDVQKYLPSLDSIEIILYQVGEKCAMKGIHLAGTKYVGVINPFFQPIITVDSIVYIGLNHYLGENYEGYQSFPEYVRHQKDISRMPYDVISSSLSFRYPFSCPLF